MAANSEARPVRAPRVDPAPLAPGARLLRLVAAYALLHAAGPGILSLAPNAWLACLSVGLWAATAQHPGQRAWLVEWFAAALYFGAVMHFTHYVFPLSPVAVGLGMGFYGMLGGLLLRRLPRHWPLAVVAPLAFVSAETLRDLWIPPYGNGWLRLGHHAAGSEFWLSTARIAGVVGLSFAFAALGGLVADLARRALGREWAPRGPVLLAGLAPGLLLWIGASLSPAPEVVPGPRIVGIQPNVSMARKQGVEPMDLIREQWTRTLNAVDPSDPPDLVVWAETMHPVPLASDGLLAALNAEPRQVEVPPWRERTVPLLLNSPDLIDGYVRRSILDALPEQTAFATGMETWRHEGRSLQRFNSLVLWEREREPQIARKRYLVPGGESLVGLERIGFVRDWILSVAGYVPDLSSARRNGGWSFGQRDRWHVAGTVCFDNAFASPYLQVLEDGPLHLHLVASNEVWYRASQEYDQMIAFSQLAAAGSGRPLLRVTNSGVSALIGADGAELERLVVDGRDRNVAGTLDVVVPVPADPEQRTPWSRWWRVGRWSALLAGPLVALVAGRRGSRARVANAT